MSELANGIAVVGLVGIASWLTGALLIPDGWIAPRGRPRHRGAAGRRGWRRTVLRVVGRGRAARRYVGRMALDFNVKWVMSQVGHTDSKMTLDVYAQLERRVDRRHGESFDRLVRSARHHLTL